MSDTLSDSVNAAQAEGAFEGLHSALADVGDTRLGEVYFDGADYAWGLDLGVVSHGPETLHDLRSVSKSIVGLLYGIALEEGLVPPLEAPLYEQFPAYAHLRDPERDKITIEHMLSMQMGLEWNEDVPYTDPRNSEIAMEQAEDRYAYILSQPVVAPAGSRWHYSGGATALVGKLIETGTGKDLEAFAAERLFKPLGITQWEWHRGSDNVASPASGLRLTLRDLARFGHVIVNGGQFEGTQVVPADWIETSLSRRTDIAPQLGYGLHWYVTGTPEVLVAFAAGNGGQRLTVQPNAKLVTASFAGLYNQADSWRTSLKFHVEFAVPAARKALGKD